MNATLIISHCIIMLCDHCVFTYMSYLFLCVLCPGLRCYSISNPKFVLFFSLLLLCHREIESKLGPKKFGNFQPFKFCHWNLNSVLSEDCFKVSLLKSFIVLHNFDFIHLPKRSYLLQWAPRLILLMLIAIISFGQITPVIQRGKEFVITLWKVFFLGY